MQTPLLPYTLGLDIGMASVGAALLVPNEQRILALHVRTFDKAETAKEGESLNKIRRDARLTRRRIRRRAHRLLRLARLLKRAGLIDAATPEAFAQPGVSPWELRAEGLECRLEARKWAAVLYHLIKHRGFQSNRKAEAKADEKAGQMLAGVGRNRELLKAGGYRSIGELVMCHPDFQAAKRNKGGDYSHTFSRAELADELRLLFARQRELGNAHAGAELEERVHALLMARRPALSGEALLKMVGHCTFEKGAYRAPKASYRAERFIWLGKLNNLKISGDGDPRPLSETERRTLIDLPYIHAKLTFKQARKALGLEPQQRFNLLSYRPAKGGKESDPESATLFEAKAYHMLRKAYEGAGLHDAWRRDALDPERLDDLGYALTSFKDDAEAREWLAGRGVEGVIVEAVLTESFEQFIHLSQKALKAILPFMEQGQRYDEAAVSAGYHHSQPQEQEARGYLPEPDRNLIRNPVVFRALNQARKLVNAIVREYGPPAAVHIELARDLSKPFDERRQIEREQKAFQDEKQKAVADFQSRFQRPPKGLDLQKWRLFREQLDQCPYCQKGLDIHRLFEDGYAQIDHALPYSRSFDDGMNNKVVAHTKCNQDKGNRTPYEWLDGAGDGEAWRRFAAWVQGNKSIRLAKRSRLLRVHFGKDEAPGFRERNLNDTRYICREFKRMVETRLQWHNESDAKNRCVVLSGQLTALLRARWGLLKVREEGDLHHALDAAVIAATSRALVKRMADHSRRNELETLRGAVIDPETGDVIDLDALRELEARFPEPWPHFRHELLARLSANPAEHLHGLPGYDDPASIAPVRVSRAPTRRGLGAAHLETIYAQTERLKVKGSATQKISVFDLKEGDFDKLIDEHRNKKLYDALRLWLKGLEQAKNIAKTAKENKRVISAEEKALIEKLQALPRKPDKKGEPNGPVVRTVTKVIDTLTGIPIRGGIAKNGAMLRVDIFTKGGKFFAVPVYVADSVKDELPNRAVVQGKPEEEWPVMDETYHFLFSLHPNDWISIGYKNEKREGYFSGLNRSTGAVDLWLHDRNQLQGKKGMLESNGIKTALSVEKYHVDLLGKLHRVHHETRQPIRSKTGKK